MCFSELCAPPLTAGLLWLQAAWRTRMYSMQMLLSPLDALQRCWADTDAFFGALPDWWAEPISVRRPFGFYYGVHLRASGGFSAAAYYINLEEAPHWL